MICFGLFDQARYMNSYQSESVLDGNIFSQLCEALLEDSMRKETENGAPSFHLNSASTALKRIVI